MGSPLGGSEPGKAEIGARALATACIVPAEKGRLPWTRLLVNCGEFSAAGYTAPEIFWEMHSVQYVQWHLTKDVCCNPSGICMPV